MLCYYCPSSSAICRGMDNDESLCTCGRGCGEAINTILWRLMYVYDLDCYDAVGTTRCILGFKYLKVYFDVVEACFDNLNDQKMIKIEKNS